MRQRDKRKIRRYRHAVPNATIDAWFLNLAVTLASAVLYGAEYCEECGKTASSECRWHGEEGVDY